MDGGADGAAGEEGGWAMAVRVARPVLWLARAEEARAGSGAEAEMARVPRAAAARLRRHLSPEGAPRTCRCARLSLWA